MSSTVGYTHLTSDVESLTQIGIDPIAISPLGRTGASAKRYYRLAGSFPSLALITDANTVNSIQHASSLSDAWGLRTPAVIQAYPEKGIILVEDVGDVHLRDLESESANYSIAYSHCLDLLLRSARSTRFLGSLGSAEELYDDWITIYLEKFHSEFVDHGHSLQCIRQECSKLKLNLSSCNYLSLADVSPDNILIDGPVDDPSSYVFIDIQDAIRAPFGADIVSLLQDVRSPIAPFQYCDWLSSHFSGLERDRMKAEMSILGLFRLLRIAGTFADLDERLGNDRYLRFLPFVRMHLDDVLSVLEASELRKLLALENWPG